MKFGAPPAPPIPVVVTDPAMVTVLVAKKPAIPPVAPFHVLAVILLPAPIVAVVYCGRRTICVPGLVYAFVSAGIVKVFPAMLVIVTSSYGPAAPPFICIINISSFAENPALLATVIDVAPALTVDDSVVYVLITCPALLATNAPSAPEPNIAALTVSAVMSCNTNKKTETRIDKISLTALLFFCFCLYSFEFVISGVAFFVELL